MNPDTPIPQLTAARALRAYGLPVRYAARPWTLGALAAFIAEETES